MSAAQVIEPVDVLEPAIVRRWFKNNGERGFGLATGFPRPAPDQLGLDGFEEGEEDQKTVRWTVFPT